MDTDELRFILRVLGCTNYRSSLTASGFKAFKGKDKICQKLGDRELIGFSQEIATVKILPPGSALLKIEPALSPLTDRELKVLEKISKAAGKITPSKITVSPLKAPEKEEILKTLSDRGFIEAETKIKKTKPEVWLTQHGIEYLRDDYNPKKGVAPVLSLDLLSNYLRFLRKSVCVPVIEPVSDEYILQIIRKLDTDLSTDNYLPIFHLRQNLQPPLTRDELDQMLYRLEKADKIEMSTLAEPQDYTPEQIEAGIPQISGGALFFIIVN
ncbi:MAG: transcription factor RcaD [Nostocaceae cyanobacterium]|nr:transcription factor RcaD [Nostocaceae cyanobacterium]